MTFESYFRASSYAMVAVAMLALVLAGGLHIGLAVAFAAVAVIAWNLEGTKWQFSERVGLAVVLISIPLFFLDWQYQKLFTEEQRRVGVNALAHLIVFLSAIKLLQVKSDRDWVFLYLISFFEMLLAAGLSFSPIFLGTLGLYVFVSLSTVIAFEIKKARSSVSPAETRLLVAPDDKVFKRLASGRRRARAEALRLPLVAATLLVLIFVLALPLFLIAPRAGSATLTRGSSSLTNIIGFSENVKLGEIGTLKASDEVVMRARLDSPIPNNPQNLRWRGVALDEFTGKGWRKSREARQSSPVAPVGQSGGFFPVGKTSSLHRLTSQTVFLEPVESAVIFTLPRAVAIQADFSSVRIDGEGSIQARRPPLDRVIYKVLSDTTQPDVEELRTEAQPYGRSAVRYLEIPGSLDLRIFELAQAMVAKHSARTRYDIAKAIEKELQNNYGYSLEMKAQGPDPLSDFLFNVRAGHCEYFSTAMAVMLRTQGIAARVVNGFLPGEYNEAADAFTIRQSDAHSWVEVYFPKFDTWVTFDPTPAAGRQEQQSTGIAARLGKYAEALELLWFQYVIGYDKQEQRSLATALQTQAFRYQQTVNDLFSWIKSLSWARILVFCSIPILVLFLVLLAQRLRRFGWRALTVLRNTESSQHSAILFYERLTKLLEKKGIHREAGQTPLEFAASVGNTEAMTITGAYNRVRFGSYKLSPREEKEIEEMLKRLESSSE
ncbi:MAG TPA: DUF3488 and transglutaminase-like domain-containing protein [Pyrinomonadaceae bacterium]|nr:DUF3488 and transglutaminase-like domain-containing protein [Pyrinomonadaceae bacterium]